MFIIISISRCDFMKEIYARDLVKYVSKSVIYFLYYASSGVHVCTHTYMHIYICTIMPCVQKIERDNRMAECWGSELHKCVRDGANFRCCRLECFFKE
jgi:hypothetical protein